ncbi:hypothetical protein H4R18_005482 [Coemansia javaensis]|uniref:Uncharacterized protein n=1 Tax=Coemansia javaensis TaxID=2761396 RepID=A0A9W8LD93_9FUNG|nr:hypothetical protein H4R18_005482 [Coemansia javaensis]
MRINLPGTREEDCFGWAYGSVDEVGTERAGQEYLQGLLRQGRFDLERLLEEPAGVERGEWAHEHMRQVCIEMGLYVAQAHRECTEGGCPVMRAGEATYYCASHERPQQCSALGYSVHTLDSAVHTLGAATAAVPRRQLQSMARRLYRIFAHAYFHHREFFERQEAASYLYARFVRLVRKYGLLHEAQLIVPDLPTTVEPVA